MKIFLSVSYSSQIDPIGNVLGDYRKQLEASISVIESSGHEVFCAPRNDAWKLNALSPADALTLDLQNIDESDILVAWLDTTISAGMQLELGYALAKNKRIILLMQKDVPLAYINQGLEATAATQLIRYSSQVDLAEKLKLYFAGH